MLLIVTERIQIASVHLLLISRIRGRIASQAVLRGQTWLYTAEWCDDVSRSCSCNWASS